MKSPDCWTEGKLLRLPTVFCPDLQHFAECTTVSVKMINFLNPCKSSQNSALLSNLKGKNIHDKNNVHLPRQRTSLVTEIADFIEFLTDFP